MYEKNNILSMFDCVYDDTNGILGIIYYMDGKTNPNKSNSELKTENGVITYFGH